MHVRNTLWFATLGSLFTCMVFALTPPVMAQDPSISAAAPYEKRAEVLSLMDNFLKA